MENFREFIKFPAKYSDLDVANMYLNNYKINVREISSITGRSVAEIYRILKKHGSTPNRIHKNHDLVKNLHDAGYSVPKIAEFTKYSPRNIRYVLRSSFDSHSK